MLSSAAVTCSDSIGIRCACCAMQQCPVAIQLAFAAHAVVQQYPAAIQLAFAAQLRGAAISCSYSISVRCAAARCRNILQRFNKHSLCMLHDTAVSCSNSISVRCELRGAEIFCRDSISLCCACCVVQQYPDLKRCLYMFASSHNKIPDLFRPGFEI